MRKFLDFAGGSSWELSPLSYDEFDRLDRWTGAPDICFGQWLRHNHFYELDQLSPYSSPAPKKGLRLEPGEPTIDWKYLEHEDEMFWLADIEVKTEDTL